MRALYHRAIRALHSTNTIRTLKSARARARAYLLVHDTPPRYFSARTTYNYTNYADKISDLSDIEGYFMRHSQHWLNWLISVILRDNEICQGEKIVLVLQLLLIIIIL